MSRKVKCKDCVESMCWALPVRVTERNFEYAKHCLYMAKNTIVCGWTSKSKGINHEQYCNRYKKSGDKVLMAREAQWTKTDIENLEKMINDYEAVLIQ